MKNKFTILIKSVSGRNSILAAISMATFWAQACGDVPADIGDSYEGVSLGSAEQALAVDAVGSQQTQQSPMIEQPTAEVEPAAVQRRVTAIQCVAACPDRPTDPERALHLISTTNPTAASGSDAQFLGCISRCAASAGVQNPELEEMFTARRVGGAGALSGLNFSCSFGSPTCSCDSYFDCKNLDKSGCCKNPIDSCNNNVCTCDVSRQCS